MSNRTVLEWMPRNFTIDDIISVYANAPLCILGTIMCLITGLVLSSDDFKEKPFAYIKIECFLMAFDLAIVTLRSSLSFIMCMQLNSKCGSTPTSRLEIILKVVVFTYLPSPIEASVLVANIIAVTSRLIQLKQKNPSGVLSLVLNTKPHRVMIISFALFAFIFSYQILSNPDLFQIEIFHRNSRVLNIVTFAIRDGLLLLILIFLNVSICCLVKTNMRRKVNLMGVSVRKRVHKAAIRVNVIILATCMTSIIGRLPIFVYIITRSAYVNLQIPGLLSFAIMTHFLSYISEFFIFFFINSKFRCILFRNICPSKRR